jgi:DNA-binding NarL/FixJ family response regulator
MRNRALIVDDHPSFRRTARVLLEAEGFEVVGEAENGAQALRLSSELQPDFLLLDVQLPDLDGFEVTARLLEDAAAESQACGESPAVILTSSRDGSEFGSLVARSGALGFVPKGELSGDVLRSLLN